MKRMLPALLALLLLLPSLVACSSFEGYDTEDLSVYLTLGKYKGISYPIVDTAVTDKEVEEAIEKVRADNMVKKELTDRVSQKGDYVVMDYTTKVEAGIIAALSAKDKTFAVGSSYTLKEIPGVSEFLIGKKAGETVTFSLSFPADYINADISDIKLVAGKDATVEITIDSLFEYVKPELDEAFVKKVSKNASTVEEYKAEVRGELEEEKKAEAESAMQEAVWKGVMEGASVVKYPQSEIKRYTKEMQEYYEEYATSYGYELEEFLKSAYGYSMETFETKKKEYAEEQVKNNLVLYSIARAENITVSEEEYKAGLQRYFEMMGEALGIKTVEEFEQYHGADVVRESVLWDEVILYLCDQAIGEEEK